MGAWGRKRLESVAMRKLKLRNPWDALRLARLINGAGAGCRTHLKDLLISNSNLEPAAAVVQRAGGGCLLSVNSARNCCFAA